ncbi:MAG: spermidine synthase [Pseudobdellovibrio sp.]
MEIGNPPADTFVYVLRGKMYYLNRSENIIKKNSNTETSTLIDSSLSTDRIFNGNYWDDFCLPIFLRKNIKRVLMLGVGYGAGIRSLLAAKPDLQIVGVDIDASSNQVCREFYNQSLGLNLEIITTSAEVYVQQCQESFDLVWIDLYDQKGALPATYDDQFWKKIESCLNVGGLVAKNAYGIANHLEKYVEATLTKFYLYQGVKYFNFYKIFPHRRNTTLVFSKNEFESNFEEHDKLSFLKFDDFSTLKMQQQRSQSIDYKISILTDHKNLFREYSFEYLNQQQKLAWKKFLTELNNVLSDVDFLTISSLVEYIKKTENCEDLLTVLCQKRSGCMLFIPTYLAAEVHNTEDDYIWLIDVFIKLKESIKESQYHVWQHIFIPQMISILNSKKNETSSRKDYFTLIV